MPRACATDDARLTPRRLRVGRRSRGRALAAGATLVLAGCGSASVSELPPGATPATSPPISSKPVGAAFRTQAVRLGALAIDPASDTLAYTESYVPPDAPQDVPTSDIVLGDLHTGGGLGRLSLPGTVSHLAVQSSMSGSRAVTDPTAVAAAIGAKILAPVESAGRFMSFSVSTGRLVDDVKLGGRPHDVVALSPSAAAVTNPGNNTVQLVENGRVVRTARVNAQPDGIDALRQGSLIAVVSARQRTLEILDGHTLKRLSIQNAGVGPTDVACAPQGPCFVVDTDGDALLVFRVGPGGHNLRLTRRVYLGSSPYGLALDPTHSRTRLWITLTGQNQLVELAAQARPHVLSRTPIDRQANAVAVDPATGDVVIAGRFHGVIEHLKNPASPNRKTG